MTTHTQGDRVYNRSGHEGEYVGKIENGPYLVRPVLECYRGDEEYTELGHLQEWEEMFDRAPVEKLDAEIAKKQAMLGEMQEKLRQTMAEIREVEALSKAQAETLRKYKALKRLEDFMEGRITHYVLKSEYGNLPQIVSLKDTVPTRDNDSDGFYGKKLRLLSFTGSLVKGEPHFVLSSYSKYFDDGSTKCHLCTSYEEALEITESLAKEKWDELRTSDFYNGSSWMKMAKSYNIPVPQDIVDGISDRKRRDKEKEIADLEARLEKAKSQIDPVIP